MTTIAVWIGIIVVSLTYGMVMFVLGVLVGRGSPRKPREERPPATLEELDEGR